MPPKVVSDEGVTGSWGKNMTSKRDLGDHQGGRKEVGVVRRTRKDRLGALCWWEGGDWFRVATNLRKRSPSSIGESVRSLRGERDRCRWDSTELLTTDQDRRTTLRN